MRRATSKDGTTIVLPRHVRLSGEAAEADPIPAVAPGPDHDEPKEVHMQAADFTPRTKGRDDSRH